MPGDCLISYTRKQPENHFVHAFVTLIALLTPTHPPSKIEKIICVTKICMKIILQNQLRRK
jgi:hypothetical protein